MTRLIDADEYYKKLKEHADKLYASITKGATYPSVGWFNGLSYALNVADTLPTVDAEPVRHGRWINISISANGNESSAECDLCGAIIHNNFSSIINYCPNCGADMKGDQDE